MKKLCLMAISVLLLCSCEKTYRPIDDFELIPVPRFPPLPEPRMPLTICIDSFDQFVAVMGTDHFTVSSVMLGNGVTVSTGGDIGAIHYEAVDSHEPNAIFRSRLLVDWHFIDGSWQTHINDVWSLGCVYAQNGQPPYTNIRRGNDTILINTAFYWGASPYQGERVDWLVVE